MTDATSAPADTAPRTGSDLVADARALFNQVCIAWTGTMGRVVGYHRDAFDSYYTLRLREGDVEPGRSQIRHVTMVTGCDSLAGLPGYVHIDADFTRNGCPPADEFAMTEASRMEDIHAYGHSSVDGGFGYDERVVLDPEHSLFGVGPNQPQAWILIRRTDYDDPTILGLEEHDENGHVVLDAPEDGDWERLLGERVVAGLARLRARRT